MSRIEEVELTNMCMICDGKGNVLVQNKTGHPAWHGWNFPGGHVEEGEYVTPSVIREMKEETGLTVAHPKLCGIKQFPIDGGRYLVFFFKTHEFDGELRSSEEGKVEWVARKDLPHIATVSDFMDMLKVFDQDELTEFQYVVEDDTWQVVLK